MIGREKDLQDKINEMHPEIREHRLGLAVAFDAATNAYLVQFTRGREVLTTRLEQQDAEDCLNNIKCVSLGIQVAQFIGNFEEREVFGRKAA
jgi:hypothetical protein